mmetsp:Transcript_652/g.2294  ORF Transcript_652/g.2294 Transcript_652/m.2294 type:complete len:528 (-) Transcript_652:52-1635(-)
MEAGVEAAGWTAWDVLSYTLGGAALVVVSVPLLVLLWLFDTLIWSRYVGNPLRKLPRATDPAESWLFGMGPVSVQEPSLAPNLRWAIQCKGAPLVYFRFWLWDRVMVTDPDLLKRILVTESSNFSKRLLPYQSVKLISGDGLVVSDFEKHDRHRKMVSEAFHYKHLKSLVSVFSKQANLLVKHWKGNDGKMVPVHEDINKCTLNVIGLTAVAYDFDSFAQEDTVGKLFGQTFLNMTKAHRDHRIHIVPFFRYLPTEANKRRTELREATNDVIASIIRSKRAQHASIRARGEVPVINDILDILIQVKDEHGLLTDEELLDETKTFVVAGNDTTATHVVWTLYALARHPEYYQKCIEEVDEVLGDKEEIVAEDIGKLKFLSMCMKESLRMYPPVPLTPRHVENDVELAGYHIPAGTVLFVSSLVMHHLPWLWEKPEVYDPYRFSPERSKDRHPYSFLPFIHGPRNCIGQRFATMEATVILAKIMQNYRLSLPADYKLTTTVSITYHPTPKLEMILRDRPTAEDRATLAV